MHVSPMSSQPLAVFSVKRADRGSIVPTTMDGQGMPWALVLSYFYS
jgi:hypothetical protein